MRILYAEDERDLNDLVTRRLVAEGYGVDSCLDGQQAWDYLQAADYDAAILDIMMPHLDGLSVLKKLRAAGKTTPCCCSPRATPSPTAWPGWTAARTTIW